MKQERRECLVTRSFGREMAAVEGDRFDPGTAEVGVLRGVERVSRLGGQMRIADPGDGQMTIPAAALVLEPALDRRSLDARGQRSELNAMQSDNDCTRMLEIRKCAQATRCDLERRGFRRDFVQPRGEALETK